MNTLRCRVCDELGAPVEGMTGQCKYCGEIFCLSHLDVYSHHCPVKLNAPYFDGRLYRVHFGITGQDIDFAAENDDAAFQYLNKEFVNQPNSVKEVTDNNRECITT